MLTVKHLTGLPINYLITVNFHGFKEVVDKLGGVWMDVDRRYYNKNTGAYYNDYANINLQPGYQQLTGQQALDFVRFRHTDDDLHRNARQQEFVRALRAQVSQNFSYSSLPSLVGSITKNIEVGEGGHALSGEQVLSYAFFAQVAAGGARVPEPHRERAVLARLPGVVERHPGGGERVPEPRRRRRRRTRTPRRSGSRSSRRRRRRRR